MSGSIKCFEYYTDIAKKFIIKMDESNGESIGNIDFNNITVNPVNELPGLPSGVYPRRVRYQSDDGRISREIIVSEKNLLTSLPTTIQSFFPQNATATTVITLRLTSVIGERLAAYSGNDTGLNDGDFT